MREDAGAGPGERGSVVGTGGHRHGEGIGLAVRWVDPRQLPAEFDGLAVGAEAGQVVGQLHEFDGARRKIRSGQERPINVFAGPPGRLRGECQRFVHPRFRVPASDRGCDQVGGLVELPGLSQFRGRNPDLRGTEGRVPCVPRSGTVFDLREIGLQRGGEVGGFKHRCRQADAIGRVCRRRSDSHRLFSGRRGGGLDDARSCGGSVCP